MALLRKKIAESAGVPAIRSAKYRLVECLVLSVMTPNTTPSGRPTLPYGAVIHSRQGAARRLRISDMYDVRTATAADLDAVIALVARLQREPAHQIGFHGETEDEVAEELAALAPDWAGGAVVAADGNGRVRGVLSVEVDQDNAVPTCTARSSTCPPTIRPPASCGRPPPTRCSATPHKLPRLAGVRTLDLFGHRENRLLADFAARHGAPVRMTTRCFTAHRGATAQPARPRPRPRTTA